VECLRDVEVLTVIGGVVYPPSTEISKGTSPAEFFRNSHGVVTPTHFWKVVAANPDGLFKQDHGLIAYWMPNSIEAVAKNIDQYVVSITELEQKLQNALGSSKRDGWPVESNPEVFDLPQDVKDHVPKHWGTLEGCDRA
jgi:DNA/RNA endonuclease G (NUC1)